MADLAAVAMGIILVLAVFLLVLQILFILNQQRTLERVSPENRAMAPGLVWLQIIPLFGSLWFFYVAVKLRDSLRAEYRARGWSTTSDFGLNIGIAAGVLQIVAVVASYAAEQAVPMNFVLTAGAFVCWIIFWVRVAAFRARLGPPQWAPGPGYGAGGYTPGDPAAEGDPAYDEGPGYDDGLAGEDDPAGDEVGDRSRSDVMFCPVCGSMVRPGDRFCHVCGSQLPWDQ